jgi:GNAT superfamily N-acetyltransferase
VDYTVRPATAADIEPLVALRLALLREAGELPPDGDGAVLAAATRAYLARALPAGEFLAWVAEAGGAVVATSGLNLFHRAPYPGNLTGREGFVLNMYTVPAWRGRGIATALMRALIAAARAQGLSRLWLGATAAGRPVYRRLGFVELTGEMELRL